MALDLVYPSPPQKKHVCISIVFKLSWDDCKFQENLETMLMQNFWGVNKVYYGKVQGANGWRFLTDALSVTVFTGYVWMVGQTGGKNIRLQTKTDTCGHGLNSCRKTIHLIL